MLSQKQIHGELMQAAFDYMRRNYQNVSLGDLL